MRINFDSLIPVYIQIAEAIEDDILSGKLAEGEAAYSQLIIARELKINPATAAKGINVLVSKEILQKQRGASMTVAPGALARIVQERRSRGLLELITALVAEATKLGLSGDELISEVRKYYQDLEGTGDA